MASIDGVPPPLLITKELDEIGVSEKANAARNIAKLRPQLSAGDLVLQMYQILFESLILAKEQNLPNDTFNFLVRLVGTCHRGFIVGLDRLLKGYLNDSYHPLRVSIEAACVAYKCHCHAHLIPVWLESMEGDDENRVYRNKFVKLFTGNEPALVLLKDIFEECSTYSHANPVGTLGYVRLDRHGIEVGYFDLKYEQELANAFWTTVDAHWCVVGLMFPILLEYMTDGMKVLLFQNFAEVSNVSRKAQPGEHDNLRQLVISTLVH